MTTMYDSRILAWRIEWTEEPGGLQSAGLQSQIRLSDPQFSQHVKSLTFSPLMCSFGSEGHVYKN